MGILISIFISIALMELYAWLDPLAKWLVDHVAKDLPEDQRADFTEQFVADLATLPNSVAKVYFAFRDCTLEARNIQQAVYRNTYLSVADAFDSFYDRLSLVEQTIETQKALVRSNLRSSLEFVSAVDQTFEALRRNQRQHDSDAETAIHHCQALSSPVLGTISAIKANFEQRHARIEGLMDRLREPLARSFEASENIRRRMLDDKPLDDNDDDDELLSPLNEEINAIQVAYNAYANSYGDLPDSPAFPENFGAKVTVIAEALQAAARVVKRPK